MTTTASANYEVIEAEDVESDLTRGVHVSLMDDAVLSSHRWYSAVASTALALVLVLLAIVALVTSETSPSVGRLPVRSDLQQDWAYWQDWGNTAESLHQALQAERSVWKWTRQETCNWQVGLTLGQPPTTWHGISALDQNRCKSLGPTASHEEIVEETRNWCWKSLSELTCTSRASSAQGISWVEAKSSLSQRIRGIHSSIGDEFNPLEDAGLCDYSGSNGFRLWTDEEALNALRWFVKNIKVYVLQREAGYGRSDAGVNTTSCLLEQGITSELIPSVHVLHPGDREVAEVLKRLPNVLAEVEALTSRTVSHFHAQTIAMKSSSSLALILEDGVKLAKDFVPRLWSLVTEEAPCDWDIISLATTCPIGRCVSPHLARVGPDGNFPKSSRCSSLVNRGLQGMLFRTSLLQVIQPRWKEVAFTTAFGDCLDVDAALSAISDEVAFYAVPAVQQPGFFD